MVKKAVKKAPKEKKKEKVSKKVSEPAETKKEETKRKEKPFLVVYNGNAGKKTETEDEAVEVGRGYLNTKGAKKAEIYKLVNTVTKNHN